MGKARFKTYAAIDLFSGCGGLSEGLRKSGFHVVAAVEMDRTSAECYRSNHLNTVVINKDIRNVRTEALKKPLSGNSLYLLAGCPPCQGFSSVRRLNRKIPAIDNRNRLILQYLRFVKALRPLTIMLENVPGIKDYDLFHGIVHDLRNLGYFIDYQIIDIAHYGVPQRRKRLVLVGSRLGNIKIAPAPNIKKTVKQTIGRLESVETSNDALHKILPKHTAGIQKLITLIPRNGGSRKDLPEKYQLYCHKKPMVGFNDIYGRLHWDRHSSTITSGCLNPSKGRFLHPEEDRVITPREAALLQTFPKRYKFPLSISKAELALLIGNALPPKFSSIQATHILNHIKQYNG
ncbi:MAG: DNA cytosine methyltransferase [Thermodesulfovibrionales bacterium]|nr:DNA cytosine methyltransferase [Thermodesulfovibrionales bacterium]